MPVGCDCVDPLATPAMIRSRPRQQADRQHLTSPARSLYPIAIDREQCTPLAHSSPPCHPPHSRYPFACSSRRFLFPTPSVHGSPTHSSRTPPSLCLDLIPYHSRRLAISRPHSLPFATPRYDPRCSLSSLLLVPPPPTLVPDSPRASSPPRYPPSLS